MGDDLPGPLVHVSQQRIDRFAPRPSPPRSSRPGTPLVWAITAATLPRQVLPRDCPRAYARAVPTTTPQDRTILGEHDQVMWIERRWEAGAARTRLWLHWFDAEGFTVEDGSAGYWVSADPVTPLAITVVDSPLAWLRAHGVDPRPVQALRPIAERVAASTLEFSVIRLHLAAA